jgi:hypothetical protein
MGISDVFTICLVSEWMEQGTICSFLSRQRNEPRVKYVCTTSPESTEGLRTLHWIDIVNDLSHMHSLEVVHGDLKVVMKSCAYRGNGLPQANTLVDNQIRAGSPILDLQQSCVPRQAIQPRRSAQEERCGGWHPSYSKETRRTRPRASRLSRVTSMRLQ